MNKLYSPWRIDYILREKEKGCIFCNKPADENDEKHLILKRGLHSYIIMNLYPYNNAHLMVVPFRHVNDLTDLNDDEILEVFRMTKIAEIGLKKAYNPDGFNIGINIGKAAGAGISDHLHIHIVPRWNGDTNFITTIGETRVIPENMQVAFQKLKKALNDED
ncbi:MAG: HIT domain-containing protein [Candidatus Cloacimonadota bacterium]|nr:HIT domain-containing protein [Candidatus Cloacimonadota bacterium]